MTRVPLIALTLAALVSGAAAVATEASPDELCRTVTFLPNGEVVESTARLRSFMADPGSPQSAKARSSVSVSPSSGVAKQRSASSSNFIDAAGRSVTIVSNDAGCTVTIDERAIYRE